MFSFLLEKRTFQHSHKNSVKHNFYLFILFFCFRWNLNNILRKTKLQKMLLPFFTDSRVVL